MNGMNNSSDDVVECPLCMEPLEVDDLNFYPCTCGYQICRFCWHRIRTDENELCPACRKEYPENPADFTPLTQEEMIAFKSQKRQRDQQRKQKITENRKHLSNVRVVQRNLVFVVGLPPRLADADVLKKHEYFGKFGKIHKVVINPSTTYAGVQGPSASAYVTYVHNCDALRAIQSVNNIMIDGRLIKTSLGTTKYCSHFMKNQQCPKGDCMYLHELGDPEASFTKEEMHQGKHQEYEKRLHDALIATSGASTASGMGTASNGNGSIVGNGNNSNATSATSNEASATAAATKTTSNHSSHSKNGDCNKLVNGNASSLSSSSVASTGSSSMSTSSTSSTSSSTNSNGSSAAAASGQQPKDAWPSLSESPVNNGVKEAAAANGGHNSAGGKSRREKSKQDRSKHDKNGRNKNRNGGNGGNSGNNHNSNNSLATTNKENQHPHSHSNGTKEAHITTTTTAAGTAIDAGVNEHHNTKTKSEKSRTSHRNSSNQQQQKQQQQQQKDQQRRRIISADEEVKLIQAADKRRDSSSSSSNRNVADDIAAHCTSSNVIISDEQRSLSTSSSNSSSDNTSTLSESTSGKSSPSSFPESSNNNTDGIVTTTSLTTLEATLEIDSKQQQQTNSLDGGSIDDFSSDLYHNNQQSTLSSNPSSPGVIEHQTTTAIEANEIVAAPSCTMLNMEPLTTNTAATDMQQKLSSAIEQISSNASSSSIIDTTAALSKLNIFDDNNSFFSSATSFQQSLLLKNKLDAELRQNQLNSVISSHLPDLLNGIDGYQNNTANSNEWEEAFKNVMRSNKQMEDQLQHPQQQHQPSSLHHQHQHQQQQQHLQQQEEFLRIQELQKRNNLLNNIGMPQMNGPHNDFPNNFHGATDLSRLSQTALIQHHQQMLQQHQERLQQSTAYSADHLLGNSLFGTNMSKFFDFHKTQQQIHQQQFMVNGHGGGNSGNGGPLSDHLRMASSLENNRINSQFLDKPPNGLLSQQQQQQQHQLQKQRLLGSKFDPMLSHPQSQQQQQQSQTALQQQQNRIPNQFSHNSSVEDDLGFDPFIETQKALAELMENEMVQQQNTNTSNSGNSSNSTAIPTKLLHQQQQQQQQHQHLSQQQHQQQLLDNMQRARMPPPGFNHMNAFGFGVPRAQNSSKILPFMNGGGGSGQPPQQPQMQMQPNSWNPHMQAAAMQQHTLGEPQLHMNSQQNPNSGNHSKGYNSSNDWTAMDPAILSFRQFSSFPQQQQQQQQPPMPHHPQDLYMQHFTQQQQQQQQNGFGNQSQLHGSVNLQNAATLLNPQNTAAQANLSHSNWLSSEQSLFMNSLTNGFTNNNNFDKFSIPMPPGIHPNNLNKQQKTECIN